MRHALIAVAILLGGMLLNSGEASAYACARGYYRSGCAGPNGAVAWRRPPGYAYGRYYRPPAYYRPPVYYRPPAYRPAYAYPYRRPVTVCGRGYYGAGCVRRW
jgi:hypothetical protein